MGWIDRLMGKPAAKPAPARSSVASGHSPSTRNPGSSQQTVRKELVRVAVRDMLLHNGIPATWIKAEPLTTAAPGRDPGVHVRLVIQQWDARLVQYLVALQDYVRERVLMLDPTADKWLMGMSWQFSLQDTSQCPALPHPGSWTAEGEAPVSASHAMTEPSALIPIVQDGNADVISGPTRIQKSSSDKRAELERLLREGDKPRRKTSAAPAGSEDDDAFKETQPLAFEKTQPMSAVHGLLNKTQPQNLDQTQPLKRPSSGN